MPVADRFSYFYLMLAKFNSGLCKSAVAQCLKAGGIVFCASLSFAQTSETLPAAQATTSSLQHTEIFLPVRSDLPTTHITVSLTPTSGSRTILTVAPEPPTSTTEEIAAATSAPQSQKHVDAEARLPVKVDKSSTAAQVQQLVKFEKQNQIGEAFLLACELVRENPRSELAYDAAIRCALVLKLLPETETFYRDAIKVAPLPGRYYVQLGHLYARSAAADKLKKLVADYEKEDVKAPDYWITLARLLMISGNYGKAAAVLEKATKQQADLFPLTMMLIDCYLKQEQPEKARKLIVAAGDQDFGPWEKRTLLLEFMKIPGIAPEEIAGLFVAALGNESSYPKARGVADSIVARTLTKRLFHPLKDFLLKQITEKKATDAEIWLAAVMAKQQGNELEALNTLCGDTAGSTPVILHERALSLANANRHIEAVPILEDLLAEQPTEVPVRLALAEQHLALRDTTQSLQTLAPLQASRLAENDRSRFFELVMSSTTATSDTASIMDHWLDLAHDASFGDLQTIGDVVVRALNDREMRQRLADAVDQRISVNDQWPLLVLRARLAAIQGEHQAELDYYEEYLRHDRDNVQLIHFVAQLAAQLATSSIRLEADSTKDKPTSFTLHALDRSATDLAIRLYTRLTELQPQVASNYSALVRLHMSREESDQARAVARTLAERNQNDAVLQARAASVLDENGMYPEALHYYRVALNRNPDDFDTWMRFAGALRSTGSFDEAEIIYHKILEEGLNGKPYNQPRVLAELLRLASAAKRIPALVTYLTSLKDKDIPGKAEFYLSASKVFMQVSALDNAEAFLKEFQAKHADNKLLPDSGLLLGELYYTRHDNAKALELFSNVQTKFPGTPGAITAALNAGHVRRQTGAAKQAIEAWTQLAKANPADDRALAGFYQSALVAFTDLKDVEQSKALFQQYLDSQPQDFSLVRKARISLYRIGKGRPPVEMD